MEHKILKTEGDVNISEERIKWQEKNNSSSEIRNLLRKDSELFLHQAMSTPCLDVLQKCDAATIENLDGKQYLDFHGNNVHQIGFSNSYLTDKIKTQYTWLLWYMYKNKTFVKI